MSVVVTHVTSELGYKLMGDSRGIVTATGQRPEIWKWACENGISVDYRGSLSGKDLWYVKCSKGRMLFTLRWV